VRKITQILGDIGKKLASGSTWKGRVGRGLSYFAAGEGASAYITHAANEKRNYYGDKSYESQFGSGAETLSGTASALGTYFGVFGALGRDPLSRIKNTALLSSAKHQNRLVSRVRGRLNAKKDAILGRDPHWGKGPKLVPGRRTFPRPGHTHGNRARFVNEPAMNRRINKYESYSPYDIKKLSDAPRVGPRALLWASTLGLTTGDTQGAATAANATPYVGAGIAGTAGLLATGYAIKKMGVVRSLIGTSVIGSSGYIGYQAANRNNNPAAEGSISSFDRYNAAGVSRMNFSTAGLVQALHNNNRRH